MMMRIYVKEVILTEEDDNLHGHNLTFFIDSDTWGMFCEDADNDMDEALYMAISSELESNYGLQLEDYEYAKISKVPVMEV